MAGKSGKKPNPTSSSSSTTGHSKWTIPKSIGHPEHHHTLTHLHQVSKFYASLESVSSFRSIQVQLGHDSESLCKKAVLGLDPVLKRQQCLRCRSILVEGLNCFTFHKRSKVHGSVIKVKCGICNKMARRIPATCQEKSSVSLFHERVQGTDWDQRRQQQQQQSNSNPEIQIENQSLSQAVKTRGDHIVIQGVGKSGSLGPSL